MYRVVRRPRGGGCALGGGRILIALVLAAFALITYFGSRSFNEVTGENQYVSITPEQEVQLGLQAAPQMAKQHGGLHPDEAAQAKVDQVCNRLLESSEAGDSDYPFECHLLADSETINAFALPGGQVFITAALYQQLETEGQLAGVLGHEIGHVVARHGAEHIAKAQLTQGLTGAAVIAASDPDNPQGGQYAAQMAILIGQLVNLKYGRDDELESDRLGVQFMADAGYDPRALLQVMEILAASNQGARPPEFFSTHPNPENRLERIEQAIAEAFPNGVPAGLEP
jgi:beta-barrel assembly-enhancing protease